MNKSRLSHPEFAQAVTSASWSQCEDLIKSFEAAWHRGDEPTIADYLAFDGEVRHALLVELVHVELELRLKSGGQARVESYLAEFPELASDSRTLVDLLSAEQTLRRRYGERVAEDEYARRFPQLGEALAEQLTWHDAQTRVASTTVSPRGRGPWPTVPGYEIIAEIGRGGMGVVYQARDPHLDRHVALKFLPHEYARRTDMLERFLREARTASALNHPHICTVHALGEHDARPFIVMEFVEGQTLRSLGAPLPNLEDVVRWIAQAARALAAAHDAGVVHRDIKPENIMVRADGYVKVLDFGLARRLPTLAATSPAGEPETDPGALLGTVAYMSPEQARGAIAETASDIFSLGIVTYELLTRQHPFELDTPVATLNAIATSPAIPPVRLNPEIPVALSGLIEAMLNKHPRLRPTAAELDSSLAALADGGGARVADVPAARPIVHRERELAMLRAQLDAAESGRGSFVCVAGEPGIGKTTFVEDFLVELATGGPACLVARGNCSERLADTEAYLPVIDALENLLHTNGSGAAARLMKIVAPTWYAQLAATTMRDEASGPDERLRATSQQAMLREFCNFLQEAARLGTVVLFLDDLHWADLSTVDLLTHLGRHCQGLRVLVIITYRPTEMLLERHAFHGVKLELQGRGVCTELALGFLTRQDIVQYLDLAFPDHAFPSDFADFIHARTEGSPLFMADLLRYLSERGVVAENAGQWRVARKLPDLSAELPESVRGMVQRKLDRLTDHDRQLLNAASVQGWEFASLIVADAMGYDPVDVEERLHQLDRVHGLVRAVRAHELPDSSLSVRYAFVHILYQQALYHDLLPTRRAALSWSIARALQRRHGDANPAVTAELACLYEVGRDYLQSARQFRLASLNAAQVFAHGEAVTLARRGIDLLLRLPVSRERMALETQLQTNLGLQLQVTEGYAAPSARKAYTRARELCLQMGTPPMFPVLWGLWLYHKVRSELSTAGQLAEELSGLARRMNDPDLALQAHQALGITAFCRGQNESSLQHVEQAAALYDPARHRTHSFQFGQDPGVICKAFGAVVLWLTGYPDAAARQSEEAICMSDDLSPSSQAVAFYFASMVYQLRGDHRRTRGHAEACSAVATEHGFSFWMAGSNILRGWALAADGAVSEGTAAMRQGLLDWQATGSVTYRTYFLGILAQTLLRRDDVADSRLLLDEALAVAGQTGEGLYEPELHRLIGESLLASTSDPDDAEALAQAEEKFHQAVSLARSQNAKSLELRAAISLARMSARQNVSSAAARQTLAETYACFTEGLDTPDLVAARELCDSFSEE